MNKVTEEMIEAGARALCKSEGHDPDKIVVLGVMSGPQWQKYDLKAEIVLEAALQASQESGEPQGEEEVLHDEPGLRITATKAQPQGEAGALADELEALSALANPAPWQIGSQTGSPSPHVVDFGEPPEAPFAMLYKGGQYKHAKAVLHTDGPIDERDASARLIALLRNSVPAILSALRAQPAVGDEAVVRKSRTTENPPFTGAAAEMRERAAKAADQLDNGYIETCMARRIAQAIRNLPLTDGGESDG